MKLFIVTLIFASLMPELQFLRQDGTKDRWVSAVTPYYGGERFTFAKPFTAIPSCECTVFDPNVTCTVGNPGSGESAFSIDKNHVDVTTWGQFSTGKLPVYGVPFQINCKGAQ